MDIIGWIIFVVLISLFIGVLLGKYLAWCYREPVTRVRQHEQDGAAEVYPR